MNQPSEADRRAHWRRHYAEALLKAELDLEYARARGNAWMWQGTLGTDINGTHRHVDGLRRACDEYRAELDFWSKPVESQR
jgi:hypothetical protein